MFLHSVTSFIEQCDHLFFIFCFSPQDTGAPPSVKGLSLKTQATKTHHHIDSQHNDPLRCEVISSQVKIICNIREVIQCSHMSDVKHAR